MRPRLETGWPGSCGRASTCAFALDDEVEQYPEETIPDLAKQLFQALDVIRKRKKCGDKVPSLQDEQDLEKMYNNMADVFRTEHTNLEERVCELTKEYKESEANLKSISQSLKSSVSSSKEISSIVFETGTVPNETLLKVMRSLADSSEKFEHYSTAMSQIARRLGMMDVQNRLHKMLDVMILNVQECDNLKSNYDTLQADFEQAKKLLKENNITFNTCSTTPAPAAAALQNNNDEKQRLFDEEELENNSQSERHEDGDSEPEKILQHLLGPKKSSVGLIRSSKERVIVQKNRWLAEGYEMLRHKLIWPWNLEQTIKGFKQGFSVMIMMLGLFVFLWGLLPSVGAIEEKNFSNPSF